METRSKTRGGLVPSSELGQVSQSLQSPPARSSSESSLNLTVICDDGTAGVVGPSRPEVEVEPNPHIRLYQHQHPQSGLVPRPRLTQSGNQ